MDSVPRPWVKLTGGQSRYPALDPNSMAGVLLLSRSTHGARLVLACLLPFCDARGNYRGTLADVARAANCGVRTAARGVHQLLALGELSVADPPRGSRPTTWHVAAISIPGASPRGRDEP